MLHVGAKNDEAMDIAKVHRVHFSIQTLPYDYHQVLLMSLITYITHHFITYLGLQQKYLTLSKYIYI